MATAEAGHGLCKAGPIEVQVLGSVEEPSVAQDSRQCRRLERRGSGGAAYCQLKAPSPRLPTSRFRDANRPQCAAPQSPDAPLGALSDWFDRRQVPGRNVKDKTRSDKETRGG